MTNHIAEEATGIRATLENGGPFYIRGGDQVSDDEAREYFLNGKTIEAPNAGAGSYKDVFARLGVNDVCVEDWTSSAGDWCFTVFDGERTRNAWQENRYPYHGFKYTLETP